MGLTASLVCDECFRRTKKMHSVITDSSGKIIGYLCGKCAMKKKVESRPKGVSWRRAFSDFAMGIFKKG